MYLLVTMKRGIVIALLLGKKENVPVYRFLKEPLIRKFGKEWYDELEIAVKELQDRGMI